MKGTTIVSTCATTACGLSRGMSRCAAPGTVCDRIASAIIPEAVARQALLEEVDVERRLSKLAEALDDLHTQLSGDR